MSISKSVGRHLLPKNLTGHRIFSGANRGKYIVTSWHDYPSAILGYCEKDLLAWLQKKVGPGETWVDIGAHYGNVSVFIAQRVGKNGRVFAFEPNLASAGCLSQTRRLNRLRQMTILPFGLTVGDGLAVAEMAEARGMVDATLRPEQSDFHESIVTIAFDEVWPRVCGSKDVLHGVKIDVQGMELSVLRGMEKTLQRLRPILAVEIHTGVDRKDFLNAIQSCGYLPKPEAIDTRYGQGAGYLADNCIYHFPRIIG